MTKQSTWWPFCDLQTDNHFISINKLTALYKVQQLHHLKYCSFAPIYQENGWYGMTISLKGRGASPFIPVTDNANIPIWKLILSPSTTNQKPKTQRQLHRGKEPGPCFNIKTTFPGIRISIIKIRLLQDHFIFIAGILAQVGWHLHTEMGPWSRVTRKHNNICLLGSKPLRRMIQMIKTSTVFGKYNWYALRQCDLVCMYSDEENGCTKTGKHVMKM